jgi:hypothetical protein
MSSETFSTVFVCCDSSVCRHESRKLAAFIRQKARSGFTVASEALLYKLAGAPNQVRKWGDNYGARSEPKNFFLLAGG